MPIAGDDAEALAVASRLIEDAGFEPVLVGRLETARWLTDRGASDRESDGFAAGTPIPLRPATPASDERHGA